MIFNVKGFLFDMDGTLVDSTAVVESVWRDFCAGYGLDTQAVIAYAHGRQTIDTLTHFIGAGEKTNIPENVSMSSVVNHVTQYASIDIE